MNTLLAKRANKFRVVFKDFGAGDPNYLTQSVVSVTLPKFSFGPSNTPVTPNCLSWDTTVVLINDQDNNVIHAVMEQLRHQIADLANSKFTMMIECLADDTVLDRWILKECLVKKFDYGACDYRGTAFDVLEITLLIEMSDFKHEIVKQNGVNPIVRALHSNP